MSRTASTKKVMVSLELTLPVECPVPERWTLDQYSSLIAVRLHQTQNLVAILEDAESLTQAGVPSRKDHLELRQLGDSHELSEPR
jgi:hypothetical protein